ncbi:Molybdopterin biosynthesis protein MoeA [hydrothermal vent metagenome]|uniref:molybdopterin molybdotransferase n=1 Tax=hydrothermal vent metagenome TaxID=652676 RepID=A0A1W1CVR1_9ZZZZ
MKTVEQALEILKNYAKNKQEIETVDIQFCLGRVIAKDICSTVNIPPYDNSAMDGFAINHHIGQAEVEISQRIPAGTSPKPLKENTAARIFTGAFIPQGADCVVIQEQCEIKDNKVDIFAKAVIGQNIRKQGEDVQIGDIVLKKGQKIRPQDMGMLASIGINKIAVYKKITVAFFSTGDELIEPGNELTKGKIYNSNRWTLLGLLQTMNINILDLGIIKDDFQSTKNALETASKKADIIISTGGVSVGEEDYVKSALENLGELMMYKVKMKPGKPFTLGLIDSSYFLGLPGNPVSAFTVFNLFARPFITQCMGSNYQIQTQEVITNFAWNRKGERREYARAKLINGKAEIYHSQSSGVLSSTIWADGLVIIMEESIIKKGDKITFIPFNQWGC